MEKTKFHTQFFKKKLLLAKAVVLFLHMGVFAQQVFKDSRQTSPLGFNASPVVSTAYSNMVTPSSSYSAFNPFQSAGGKLRETMRDNSTLRTIWPNWGWADFDRTFYDADAGKWWRWKGDHWEWIKDEIMPVAGSPIYLMLLCCLYAGFIACKKQWKSEKNQVYI